jgi:2-iminobutanoate/2-iminopropanoate deaminase
VRLNVRIVQVLALPTNIGYTLVQAYYEDVAGGTMDKEVIATEEALAAVGPYSQAVRVGELVFTAGQVGLVPGTKHFAGPDIRSQTRQALQNISDILDAAGSCMEHVVKATVFLQDIQEYGQMNEVYAEFFTKNPPARSAVQVAALPLGARVEIEVVAEACDCNRS